MPPKRKKVDDDDDDYVEEYDLYDTSEGGSGKRKTGPKLQRTNATSKRGSFAALMDEVEPFQDYSKTLKLKSDHEKRPIWVTKNNLIILEAFSAIYKQAYDFVVAIAEPESRPEFIHCYRLTENSLYAAVAVFDTESIIKFLSRLCKTELPPEVPEYIRQCTYTFGKAKIVLKDNNFYIESKYQEILRELLKNPIIRNARVLNDKPSDASTAAGTSSSSGAAASGTGTGTTKDDAFLISAAPVTDARNVHNLNVSLRESELDYTRMGVEEMDAEEDDLEGGDLGEEVMRLTSAGSRSRQQTVSFQIAQQAVQLVKRSAKEESRYPLMEEYDFKNDHRNPVLSMDLRPSTRIRPYQEKSLSQMFGNGRARSGIIVLPCGAGKSLTGVTAASTVKRACMVMCINNASVKQWKEQFIMWTNVQPQNVKLFTSGVKEPLPPASEACIVITTYSMVCHGGRRSESGEKMIQSISGREWGLMILDEVHVAPADMFQKVVHMVNAHCKLGLTATLVREDNKIKDLSFLVGPKLYEANWIDLTNDGYLARVQCVEVWCPMTKEFYAEYIRRSLGNNSRLQRLLYTLNPRKFRACEYLVNFHTKRGDKIIIFSDDVPALFLYCEALSTPAKAIPYIYGGTKDNDRRDLLNTFKTSSEHSCIGLSKVGDTALDIPEANVIIQISSHFGARRQEAQRLGRILRPKPNPTGGFNAFFYTLISTDTKEMFFSTKRQQYLIDQGYTFKVVQDLADIADRESVLLTTVEQEVQLLNKVLCFNYASYDAVEDRELSRKAQGEMEEDDEGGAGGGGGGGEVRRRAGKLSAVSGAGESVYTEFDA